MCIRDRINGGTFETHCNVGGTTLYNGVGGTMTINGCVVNADFFAINNEGDMEINGGEFHSTSTNEPGTFAYCVRNYAKMCIRDRINIADEHIFQDNMNRINLGLRDQALRFNFDNLQDIARCRQMFEGALKASLELSKRNYKLVAPQFWPATGKIQFLMPIYLEGVQAIQEGESKEVLPPTVALSMEMVHGQYIGCLLYTSRCV